MTLPSILLDFKGPIYIDGKTFFEFIHPNLLNALIDSDYLHEVYDLTNHAQSNANYYHSNERNQLIEFRKNYNVNVGAFEVTYKLPKQNKGRVNVIKALGSTGFRKGIRNTLLNGMYVDIDLCNAQPSITYNICIHNNIPCPYLTELINNREEILEMIMTHYDVNRSKAKKLILRLSFSGTVFGWKEDNELDTNIPDIPFITSLINEFNDIATKIKEYNLEFYNEVKSLEANKSKSDKKVLGSFMALYLQTYELKIIDCAIQWLCEENDILNTVNNGKLLIYEYDGIKIGKKCVDKYEGEINKLIQDMENIILERTGFKMKFEEKEMEIPYKLEFDKDISKFVIEQDKYKKDLYSEQCSSSLIAKYFLFLYPDKFVCVNDIIYFYNGIYWEKEDKRKSNLVKFLVDVFHNDMKDYQITKRNYFKEKLTTEPEENHQKIKNIIERLDLLGIGIHQLKESKYREEIIKDIISFSSNNKIEFDKNPYLVAFEDCVYDLKEGKFVKPKYTYYISKTTKYKYKKSTIEQKKKLNELLDSIFPNPEIKDYYLTILSTGLCGFQMENLFIATGKGGNGKSLINSLMLQTVGDYGYKLPSNALLKEIKEGANPEMANLNNKRFVLTQEPDHKKKINSSTMKEISGDKTLNVRGLYESKCGIYLKLTLMMECNNLPLLDEVNDAVTRRIRVILFESKFVDKSLYDCLSESEKLIVNEANPYFKTDEFQDEYKCVLFDLLCDYFQAFMENEFKLKSMPVKCAEKCKDYLATSDDIFGWFNEYYEKTDTIENSEAILLTDIFNVFKYSDYYNNMSKADKRTYNRKHFVTKIEENMFMDKFLRMKNTYWNKIKMNGDYIIGWKKRPCDEEEIGLVEATKVN